MIPILNILLFGAVTADVVCYARYRMSIPGSLARRKWSLISQCVLLSIGLTFIVSACVYASAGDAFSAAVECLGAGFNVFLWHRRGYDDDLWSKTKKKARDLGRRLIASTSRSGALAGA